MTRFSSIQPAVVYNFSKIESTFPVPFLKLRGQLLMAPWHGFHLFDKERQIYNWFFHEGLFLDWLFFFSICCDLSAVENILPRQILNLFLHFLHPFVLKHFRIFVAVMRYKFHCHLVFQGGNLHEHFLNFVMWRFACMA